MVCDVVVIPGFNCACSIGFVFCVWHYVAVSGFVVLGLCVTRSAALVFGIMFSICLLLCVCFLIMFRVF